MGKTIAWIDQDLEFTLGYRYAILKKHSETRFIFHQTADAAWRDLTTTPYDLIVMELMLAPGKNSSDYSTDNGLISYSLGLIMKLKETEGLNKNCPIIAIYSGLNFWGSRPSGINELIDSSECLPSEFYKIVKKYLE